MSEITSIFIITPFDGALDNLAWGPNPYFDAWPYQECASSSQFVSLEVLHSFLNGSLRYFDTLNKILRQLAEQFCKYVINHPSQLKSTTHPTRRSSFRPFGAIKRSFPWDDHWGNH